MSKVFNMVGGGGGPAASIFVTGLSETDTVTATNGSKTLTGKWVTKINKSYQALIPSMTSNSVPSGVASSLTALSGNPAYKAFDGIEDTNYASAYPYKQGQDYVQYQFADEVEISEIRLYVSNDRAITFRVSTSLDGTDWQDIHSFTRETALGDGMRWLTPHILSEPVKAKYIRCTFDLWTDKTGNPACLSEMQVYGNVDVTESYWEISNIRDMGTWTVTATDGVRTAIQDVLVDVITEYEIDMNYTLYLYRYGDECEDVTGGWVGTDGGYNATKSGTKNSDSLYCADGSWSNMVLGTNNKVNFTGYTKMYVTRKQVGTNLYQPWVTALIDGKDVGDSNRYPGTGQASAQNVVETAEVDISAISGEHYVIFCNSGSNGAGYLYQLWLE